MSHSCTYVKRFKAEKAKIIRCNDSIACSTFRKWLPADHPLFVKLIMGENLTLADSYALAEEARPCGMRPSSPMGTSKKISAGTIPQIEMTQRLRHSPSSQCRLAKFSVSSKMNHGSNCRHLRRVILPNWIRQSIAHSTKGQVTLPTAA